MEVRGTLLGIGGGKGVLCVLVSNLQGSPGNDGWKSYAGRVAGVLDEPVAAFFH